MIKFTFYLADTKCTVLVEKGDEALIVEVMSRALTCILKGGRVSAEPVVNIDCPIKLLNRRALRCN